MCMEASPWQTPLWPHVALTKFVPGPPHHHHGSTQQLRPAASLHRRSHQQRAAGPSPGDNLDKTEDLEDLGTFWTQEEQYSSLSFLTTEHLRALIKNHEVRSPFVTLFSLAVHSSLKSQSYTSTLFSTSEKWDRARTLSLFYFRISEAGGISSKGNGPLSV